MKTILLSTYKIRRSGLGNTVTLPLAFLHHNDLKAGDPLDMFMRIDGTLIIKPRKNGKAEHE